MPKTEKVEYVLSSSLIEEKVDIEARTVYEFPFRRCFSSLKEAMGARSGLPDYKIVRRETIEQLVASSEEENEY